MRIRAEKERDGWLVRAFDRKHGEIAYALIALRGLQAEVEFPSDWHEDRRGWVRLGFGFARLAFSFPWARVVPDEFQCSGPTYGFVFFEDGLHLRYGKCKGMRDDPIKIVQMPWGWRHRAHEHLGDAESHPYTYTLRSGEVQQRIATITPECRTWTRPWLPWKRVSHSIWIEFDQEVGERSGSWKGGVTGCGYPMKAGEMPLQALRRMEAERKFT